MTEVKIGQSSPVAFDLKNRQHLLSKYPWRSLKVGTSFYVHKAGTNFSTLRTLAYRTGNRHGKIFRVIEHGPCEGYPSGIYEVACLGLKAGKSVGNTSWDNTPEQNLDSIEPRDVKDFEYLPDETKENGE